MTSPIPVLKSFIAPDVLSTLIAHGYGFDDVRCELIKGTVRDVYRVESAQGRYIAILYPVERSVDAVNAEIALCDFLVERGFHAPSVVRRVDGQTYEMVAMPEGARCLMLTAYIDGTFSRQPTLETIEQVGVLIAQFHQLTDAFPPDKARPRYNAAALLDEPLRIFQTLLIHQEAVSELQQIADSIKPLLSALPDEPPYYGIIHADLIPSNVMIAPDETLNLIDYDFFGTGWRMFDLANYINEIAFWNMGESAIDHFLNGYGRLRALARWEFDALPLFRVAIGISHLKTPVAHVNIWGSGIYLSDRVFQPTLDNIRAQYALIT